MKDFKDGGARGRSPSFSVAHIRAAHGYGSHFLIQHFLFLPDYGLDFFALLGYNQGGRGKGSRLAFRGGRAAFLLVAAALFYWAWPSSRRQEEERGGARGRNFPHRFPHQKNVL